ncbi:MAG: ester cyclase [Actinomycetota bacterium]|nr:ester cyclase [Actinomycetota bacterium]
MSAEDTRATMTAYLDALNGEGDFRAFLTDDVVFTAVGTDQEFKGADAVQTIDYFHTVAFEVSTEVRRLVVTEDQAAAELVFHANHIGDFAGIPATGKSVSIPFSVFYDLAGGKVASIRVYQLLGALLSELGPVSPA